MSDILDIYWTTKFRDDGWVQIDNFVIPVALSERKTVWRTFRELEDMIAALGRKGWLMWTKAGNAPIIKAISHLGGTQYAERDGLVFFKRQLNREG